MPFDSRFNTEKSTDVFSRLKMSRLQNIYDADFEYGQQPLRWESLTNGTAAVTHLPGQGGVFMNVGTSAGDIAIRQSRPYHRYQPGKMMSMASAVVFDPAVTNNRQRVGFFDDSNGCFFEQADPTPTNPSGMFVVVRSDASGVVTDTRISIENWNGPQDIRNQIVWGRIQMIAIEYAWYGAGAIRWLIYLNGELHVLHSIGIGNSNNILGTGGMIRPWSRTGNLPVRYETRNIAATSTGSNITHYGVSVNVDGGVDEQRGFTYSYGPTNTAPRRAVANLANRVPILSVRGRQMGTQEYTQAQAAITAGTTTTLTAGTAAWTVNQWQGRCVNYVVGGANFVARILSNTATVLTIADVVTGGPVTAPVAGQNYTIGMINRGQILPRRLQFTSDQPVMIEIFTSAPPGTTAGPIVLTGPTWTALSGLGSSQSFAERDVAATSFSGGENVYSIFVPANNPVDQQIDNLFPLVNTIRGNATDILTVAASNTGLSGNTANVSCQIIAQEAMS